jgi:gluconolactonase
MKPMSRVLLGSTLAVSSMLIALGAAPTSPPSTASASAASKPASPVAPGAQPEKLAGNYGFTEGCCCDKDGNIFFVDQNNNDILEWSVEGKLSKFMHATGYSNGMCFDNQGNLITCADEKNELWQIAAPFPKQATTQPFTAADLKVTVLIKNYDGKTLNPETGGKQLNGPNDVWVVPAGPCAGGMYITDPLFARNWWTNRPGGRGAQQSGQYAYYLSPDHKTLTPVITDYRQPNGVIGTPDGKTLYVADMGGRVTNSFTINADGSLSDKKFFCNAGSDGMTIDSDGNVYTTNGPLVIWDKNGKQLDSIRFPRGTTNVCFGGKDRQLLFICAGDSVYGLKMTTHGVGSQ